MFFYESQVGQIDRSCCFAKGFLTSVLKDAY
jgi:hypothetical protein